MAEKLLICAKCQHLSVVSAAVSEDQQGLNLSAEVSYLSGVHPLMLGSSLSGLPKADFRAIAPAGQQDTNTMKLLCQSFFLFLNLHHSKYQFSL